MVSVFSEEWFQKQSQRKQQNLERLKRTAMEKLRRAALKQDRESIREASEAVLIALRAGVDLDARNPDFCYFKKERMWAREMERACKNVMSEQTKKAHKLLEWGVPIALGVLGVLVAPEVVALKVLAGIGFALLGVGANKLISKHVLKTVEYNQNIWDRFCSKINGGWGGWFILGNSKSKNMTKSLKDVFQKQTFRPSEGSKKSQKTPKKVPKWLARVFLRQHMKYEKYSGRRAA